MPNLQLESASPDAVKIDAKIAKPRSRSRTRKTAVSKTPPIVKSNSTTQHRATDVIKRLSATKRVYYTTRHIADAFGIADTKKLRRQMRNRNIRIGSGNRHELKLADAKSVIKRLCSPPPVDK